MKLFYITVFVISFAFIVNGIPIPEEESATPNDENNESEIEKSEPVSELVEDNLEEITKPQLHEKKETVVNKSLLSTRTKPSPVISNAKTSSSNQYQMHINSWGPKDFEYSFESPNQMQAKTIHIEENPDDKDNPYEISDKGSFSTNNEDHGYEYKVEYIAGSKGYRPKVSFSFHS